MECGKSLQSCFSLHHVLSFVLSIEKGPGQFDKNNNGQVHFFPVIANPEQLKAQFELRGCAKIEA